jgi:transposase
LVEDFNTLDQRLENLNKQIASIAARDDQATRLATIPGIGLLTATALVSAIGNAVQFKKARDLSAWLGLVPAQHSTGGKTTLGSISKRGNAYIRRLLIHGARSVLLHLDRDRSALGRWIDSLEQRVCRNKIVVAIANKIARIAWVISRNPGSLYLEKSAMPA